MVLAEPRAEGGVHIKIMADFASFEYVCDAYIITGPNGDCR